MKLNKSNNESNNQNDTMNKNVDTIDTKDTNNTKNEKDIESILENNRSYYILTNNIKNESKFEKIDNNLITQIYNKEYNKWYIPTYMYIIDSCKNNGIVNFNIEDIYTFYGFKYTNKKKKDLEEIFQTIKDFCYLDNIQPFILDIIKLNTISIKDNISLIIDKTTMPTQYYTELEYIDYYKIIAIAKKYKVDCCKLLNFFCYIINHFNKKEEKSLQHCYCGYNNISNTLHISKTTILQLSDILEKNKVIKIKHGNKTTSNSYYKYIEESQD